MTKKKTGVQEWAKHSFNFQKGCMNGCKYCYARRIMKRFEPDIDFDKPVIGLTKTAERLLHKKVGGVIMFPTMHDITEENKTYYRQYLYQLLKNDNKVLVVSKGNPQLKEAIDFLTCTCPDKLSNLEIRITIGSLNDEVLKYFEPNAPACMERINMLKFAYKAGIKTSISCEPMLDDTVVGLISCDYADEIWFGLANGFYEEGMPKITDDFVKIIINTSKKHPEKIKLKDSLKGLR